MKLFIACGVCAAFNSSAAAIAAEAHEHEKGRNAWTHAVVTTDGAAVYARPDFDSPVQDYLTYETPVVISKRPYSGVGGLGLFYRVYYQKKFGYITDTDIRLGSKEIKKTAAAERAEESKGAKAPVYLTRYFGLAVSRVHFTEKFSGHKLSDHMIMYGLRMTGPGTLFDGPPLDFNFWFSLQKPGYYSRFTSGSPNGFLIFGDLMAMMPLINLDNNLVSYGLGLMYVYTKYTVPVKNQDYDSQELRMGVDFGLGFGHRFGRFIVRADTKYYIEKTQYGSYLVSFQMEY